MSFGIKGQGVFLFKDKSSEIKILFTNRDKSNILRVILNDRVSVFCNTHEYRDTNNKSGTVHYTGAYYWISINAQTQQVHVGVGEPRLETAIYSVILTSQKQVLESLRSIETSLSTNLYKVLKDPITQSVPMLIRNTDELTMSDIASNAYMPVSCLSLTSQKLYNCISGKKFVLDDSDFPDFSKAIEFSISTPGKWCYEKLQQKSREFNKTPNIAETYLRITLGQNNGESPGIPYVMEIWPPGHYSPVHSHAGASAIIRVLYGEIHVKLYPFLCAQRDSVSPFKAADFSTGDITWISPSLNQTHQLVNHSATNHSCITIQCYMYEDENTKHYDYFDYLDENGQKKQYEPDSDMDFIHFKELIRAEWKSSKYEFRSILQNEKCDDGRKFS